MVHAVHVKVSVGYLHILFNMCLNFAAVAYKFSLPDRGSLSIELVFIIVCIIILTMESHLSIQPTRYKTLTYFIQGLVQGELF